MSVVTIMIVCAYAYGIGAVIWLYMCHIYVRSIRYVCVVFTCSFDFWWEIHSNDRSLLYSHKTYTPPPISLEIVTVLTQSCISIWKGNTFQINNVCRTEKFLRRTSVWAPIYSKTFEDVVFAGILWL